MGGLHEALGLDPTIHEDPGTPPSDAAGVGSPRLEAALRAAGDDQAVIEAAAARILAQVFAVDVVDPEASDEQPPDDVRRAAAAGDERSVARALTSLFGD